MERVRGGEPRPLLVRRRALNRRSPVPLLYLVEPASHPQSAIAGAVAEVVAAWICWPDKISFKFIQLECWHQFVQSRMTGVWRNKTIMTGISSLVLTGRPLNMTLQVVGKISGEV